LKSQADKLRYLLNKFKNIEWSGPAWYSEQHDKDGFPTNVVLEYFHPLDLGGGGHTEWDGKKLIKVIKPLVKKYPKIGKEWVQGNIHSHHNMGAFFSGTDEQQLEDGAFKDMFYYSLVVSHKAGKELAFALSYVDGYNRIHIEECDEIEVERIEVVEPEWKKQVAAIQKDYKKSKKTRSVVKTNYYGYGNGYTSQAALWDEKESKDSKKKQSTMSEKTNTNLNGSPKKWKSMIL